MISEYTTKSKALTPTVIIIAIHITLKAVHTPNQPQIYPSPNHNQTALTFHTKLPSIHPPCNTKHHMRIDRWASCQALQALRVLSRLILRYSLDEGRGIGCHYHLLFITLFIINIIFINSNKNQLYYSQLLLRCRVKYINT